MATNVEEEIDANVDTEGMGTAPPTDAQNDTPVTGNGQNCISQACRTRLVTLGRLLLHLVCLGYSLYLIWLLAHVKDNNNYWFLSFIPIFFNFVPFLLLCKAYHDNDFLEINEATLLIYEPSIGVVFNLMACFTMLTRQAYYHRQPDEFVGPRFIILSLQASIILILLDFVLQRLANLDSLLDYKDAFTRVLLDFVDIFNMVEILSVNVCVGVGSYVSEDSSTERAIQAFCTMSFMIVLFGENSMMTLMLKDEKNSPGDNVEEHSPRISGEILYSEITKFSGFYQNLPFLVIRIVVWAQYKLYSLGFLVKNVTVIVLFIVVLVKN